MLNIMGMVGQLKRPALLATAARMGAAHYRRDRLLKKILNTESLPRSGEALIRLMEIEADQNAARVGRAAVYDVAAHVETWIAIMGEATLYRAATAQERLT